MASGALRTNPTIAERLNAATLELGGLETELAVDEANAAKVVEMLPRVAERYRRFVADLPRVLAEDVAAARETLGGLIGGAIRLSPDAKGRHLVGEYGLSRDALVFACLGRRAPRGTYISNGSGGRI